MGIDRIVIDDNIYAGQAHIEGTAMSVEIILRKLAAGEPIEQILDGYPYLKREDILACLDFALQLVKNEWEQRTGFKDFDPGPIADWGRK